MALLHDLRAWTTRHQPPCEMLIFSLPNTSWPRKRLTRCTALWLLLLLAGTGELEGGVAGARSRTSVMTDSSAGGRHADTLPISRLGFPSRAPGVRDAAIWLAAALVSERWSVEQQPGEIGKAVLDLSKKETYQLLDVNAPPEQVVIENVEVDELPAKHRLVPKSGTARLGQPLDIQLEQPQNVRIRLAVVKRGNDVALRISPQIVIGPHNTIDLTRDRITRTTRNFLRRVKDLNQQLAALAAERQALNVWLISPGNKPLRAVREAHFRVKMLNQAIKARQQEIPIAQRHCAALHQAAEFVRQLHKHVEIRYEVRIDRQAEQGVQ